VNTYKEGELDTKISEVLIIEIEFLKSLIRKHIKI